MSTPSPTFMSSLTSFKRMGARFSVATLTAQLALGTLSLAAMPTIAVASDELLSDNFGIGTNDIHDIPGWDEDDGTGGSTEVKKVGSNDDTASPDGSLFALIQKEGWVCRQVDAAGYDNVVLKFYERGDKDAEDNEYGYAQYFTMGTCASPTNLVNLATYELDNGNTGSTSWSSLQSVNVPVSNAVFFIRFYNGANSGGEDFRIDGVVVEGDAVSTDGTVTVNLTITNDNGGTLTSAGVDLELDGNGVMDGDANVASVGDHTVSSNTVVGYTVTIGDDCNGAGVVTVGSGEDKTCSVTYDDIAPQLTVIKEVVNDDGGELEPGDFTMYVDGTNVSDDSFPGVAYTGTTVTLDAGEYEVSEDAVDGYVGELSEDCSGTIDVGESKTCTITNDDVAAMVTVYKVVVNDDGGTFEADEFQLTLSQGEADTEFSSDDEGTSFELEIGVPFSVTEQLQEGQDYTASYEGDCEEITPEAGGSYECTITNDDNKPSVTVVKYVVDEEEDAKLPGDFSLFVNDGEDDVSVSTNVSYDFAVGSYTVGEVEDQDYDGVVGGDCSADGSLELAFGEDAQCTITNTAVFVEVCQVNPGNTHTILLRPSEVEDHLAAQEEDYLGPCEGDEEHEGSTLVCHHGEDKWVNDSAVGAHLGHGDTLGSCEGGEEAVCGNSAIEDGETCDDGDTDSEDGCSATCQVEDGYECSGEPSICEVEENGGHCGNGNHQPSNDEQCDDGNNVNGDGCSATCSIEDGYECVDDGNLSICTATEGNLVFHKYLCTGAPTLSREINGPSAEGTFVAPESCNPQSGVSFSFIYQADKDDTSPPYPGLDDETPFTPFAGTTDGDGELTVSDLSTDGRYMVAEMDGEDLLAFYCYGDGGTGTNNYEAVFIDSEITIHCVAYNHEDVIDDNDSDDDGVTDDLDNCVEVSNADQADNDHDGTGNVCDETPNGDGPGNSENSNANGGGGGNEGNGGSRRGHQTNRLGSLLSLLGGSGNEGDVPPGGFGGPGNEEFTEEEAALICALREAIPADANSAVYTWVAEELAEKMPHSVDAIAFELRNGGLCDQPEAAQTVHAKPVAFHVDVAGFPVSSNDTWNKCIRGTATLADIRANEDRDEDGFGYSCSRYHTANLWKHPDLGILFTFKKLTKAVNLPAGYALKQDATLTQR